MKDLKKDIQENGLNMEMGLFDPESMDPNGIFCDSCTGGCSGGCWWSNAPGKDKEQIAEA